MTIYGCKKKKNNIALGFGLQMLVHRAMTGVIH